MLGTFDGIPMDQEQDIMSDAELMESIKSFGTGSFTTNTFNNRLQSSAGMRILRYI